MNESPHISVIIPVYNHEKELRTCLASLYAQTLKPFEIIVVDDGSAVPVCIPDMVSLKLLRQKNAGAPQARNNGFDVSTGDFVIFCDADVILKPHALEKMYAALLQNQQADFAYSSFYFGFKKFTCGAFDKEKLKKNNYIHTTSLMRRSVFPRFDQSLTRFQDWDLWLSIVRNGGNGVWIPEILFKVTPHRNGMSTWLPSWAYYFKFLPAVKRYHETKKIVQKKHGI